MASADETQDRRGEDRRPLTGEVIVRFSDTPLEGSGQNISPEGVYFVSEGAVRVRVWLEGRDEPVEGSLVRVATMGDGKTGIAVAFDQEVGPREESVK